MWLKDGYGADRRDKLTEQRTDHIGVMFGIQLVVPKPKYRGPVYIGKLAMEVNDTIWIYQWDQYI